MSTRSGTGANRPTTSRPMYTRGASCPDASIRARSAAGPTSAKRFEWTTSATTATIATSAPMVRSASTRSGRARRREAELELGVPLGELDEVREVPVAEPGADRGDERLRDLRRGGRRHTALAREIEEQ